MPERTYDHTIDWEEYWEAADAEAAADASPSTEYIVEPLREFFERRGIPDSYADVGCGAGAAVFHVAENFPETTAVGYDSAEPVLAENRKRAREGEYTNVSFDRTHLPEFDADRKFEAVSSFFTLCYVADLERALKNLYDAVAPGGHLIFTYHNEYAQSTFENIAESPHAYLDESSRWDPERFADRFELVLDGESLLSYRRIYALLGSWPRSVWSVTGEAERYGAWRMNPLVYVPK